MKIPIYKSKKKKNLVISGGSIKGIAFIGSLKALHDNKYLKYIDTFAGTSVGSLIASLIVIGYTPDELLEFVEKFDLTKLLSINVMNLPYQYGLDDGKRLMYVVEKLIAGKGFSPKITLFDLYEQTKKHLIITSVCLNTSKIVYLDYLNYPQMLLVNAIRMSTSLPGLFIPFVYENNYYVDGGCINNYIIDYFKDELDKTIGLCLVETYNEIPSIDNVETYCGSLMQCFLNGITHNSKKGYDKQTIEIIIEYMNLFEFNISKDKIRELYNCGYQSCDSYLKLL